MLRASWKALLTVGIFLPVLGVADDAESTDSNNEYRSVELLLAEYRYAPRWRLTPSGTAIDRAIEQPQPIDDVQFEDNSALGRVSRIRSLSLLTLAEAGNGRLFFGINDDGLVGLHFSALSRRQKDRNLEIARMPYLKDVDPDGEPE